MYDANGNTISSGGISFAYNFQNQLVQSGGLTAGYDGDGNRVYETVGGTTTQYLIDTLNPTGLPQVMDELQNGAVTRTYAYGLERISEDQLIGGTWTPSFYGYDGHGSTRPDAFTDTGRSALSESDRFLTNMAGGVTDTYQYDAFGNLIDSTGTTPNNDLFAGEQFDPALGFYYMRARYYRAATGRFWTMDPVEGKLCCGLSWNPYVYTLDNPVDSTDPTGRIDLAEVAEVLKYRVLPAVQQVVQATCFYGGLAVAIAEQVYKSRTGYFFFLPGPLKAGGGVCLALLIARGRLPAVPGL